MRYIFWMASSLLLLTACNGGGSAATPTLSISPGDSAASPGDTPLAFNATLSGASTAISWSLNPATGSGTLSAPSGPSVQYAPPDQITAASAVTLTATAGSLSKSVQISLNPLTQFYADPAAGLDTNPGTQAKPLKTIKEALTRMGAGATKTTVLLAGTYSEASGETWDYTLPDGITLKGNSAGVILQSTTKKAGFTFGKGATLSDLSLTGFSTALTATNGTQTLTRLAFSSNQYDLKLSSTASAGLQDCTSSGSGSSIQAAGLSQISVQGGNFNATSNTLILQQSATASFSNTEIGGGTLDTGGSSTLSLNTVKAHDISGYSIYVRDSSTQLFIQGGSFYNNGKGNANTILSSGKVTINNASFSSNYSAIGASAGSLTITNSSVVNSTSYGITIAKGVAFKMRKSTVAGNGSGGGSVGIYIADATAGIDLGTASDPGGNTIKDNGGASYPNLSVSGAAATIQAVGNTWNASTQGADASGHYGSSLISASGSYLNGKNYYLAQGLYMQF